MTRRRSPGFMKKGGFSTTCRNAGLFMHRLKMCLRAGCKDRQGPCCGLQLRLGLTVCNAGLHISDARADGIQVWAYMQALGATKCTQDS